MYDGFFRIILAIDIIVAGFSALTASAIMFLQDSAHRFEGRFTRMVGSMLLISTSILLLFVIFDKPIPGELEKMEFLLSEYKEEGKFYDCYLVYDDEIEQYKYCCFDDEANLIGLTAPLDSEIIRIPKTDYLAEPYSVEIISYEVTTRLTHRPVAHITHQIFFIPDEEYAIVDKENLQQFRR